jgi:hypothetical protein
MASATGSSRRAVWAVWVAFACLYALSLGRGFYSSDGEVMFLTTAALAERGTFAIAPDPALPQIVAGSDGAAYSKYDPGLPLVGVPFFVVGDWLGGVNHAHRYRLAALAVLLVPALSAAGALAALAALAGDLFPRRRALGVALAAGAGTLLWPYARVLFAEATLACALMLAVFAIWRAGHGGGRGWWIVAGAAFGWGITTRAALAIYAFPLAVLVARLSYGAGPRATAARLAATAAGAAPGVALVLWHNALRFGDPLAFGYAGEGFSTAPWVGAAGLLFSPGKSIFLYAPPLVASVLLWPRFRRVQPALADFLALAWASALAFYGAWWAWHGGWSWGPRLLVPLAPLSCLPLGVLPDRRGWRALAAALMIAGVGVQIAGVLADTVPHYAAVAGAGEGGYHALHYTPGESPLIAAFERVLRGQTEPLAAFHLVGTGLPRTWTAGVPLVLLIGLGWSAWAIWRAARARPAQ